MSSCFSSIDQDRQTMAEDKYSSYNGVKFHPECARMYELRMRFPRHSYISMGLEEARKEHYQKAIAQRGHYDFSGSVTDLVVPSKVLKDGIPIRVYKPVNVRPDPAILVYFHGDGMILGSIEAYDVCCQMLADRCQCIIVSVEHRLAPEHQLPAGLDDCDEAARWILKNKTDIGGTHQSVVGVGGDGGGGKAASLCPHYVQGLGFQVLIYPNTDERLLFPSYKEYLPMIRGDDADWFRKWHLNSESPTGGRLTEDQFKTDPRLNAVQQPRFDQLPPALFIVAECHILRDGSFEYQKKLNDAGVLTEFVPMKGALHDFFHLPGFYKDLCYKAYGSVAAFISRVVYKDQ